MTTAVVVGGGPNGLAAALHLARQGVDVKVLEAFDVVGGGARSGEYTVPGVIHDHCSAFHPLGAASPFWSEVGLEKYGLQWKWPEVDCAHPLDDGEVGLLYRSLAQTEADLGEDGPRWKDLLGSVVRDFDKLSQDVLRPILHRPVHPLALANFALRAVLPASVLARYFQTEPGRALFGGIAAHAFTSLDSPLTSSLGVMIAASGHRYGWPVAEGGSGSIVAALVAALTEHGVQIQTNTQVRHRSDIPDADLILLDLSPKQVVELYGDQMPARIKRAYKRYRTGSSAFKVDYAIEGDIPWKNAACLKAGTVHLGGNFAEIRYTERMRAAGTMVEQPFVLVGQQYVADPSRSHKGINPIYAYGHVPSGYDGNATELITTQIERFAPGFRERIIAVQSMGAAQLEKDNANFAGGDIIGGANDGLQMVFRPRIGIDPYNTGIPGVYICSQATPPGAGVHGLCGWHAASSALS